MSQRIENEVAHGKFLSTAWSGKFWYWETAAGKIRWQRRVKMLTAHLGPGVHVLELGCGVGYFTKEMAKARAKITAIDISTDLLAIARSQIKDSHVTFKVENAYKMSFSDNTFDAIVGSSVLHHLDILEALRECYRVLKPGGSLFFTEPNMLNPQIFLQKNVSFFRKMCGDSPDERAFVRWPLKKLFSRYGFIDVQITPFDFLHPLTPRFMVPLVNATGACLEKIPLINEIAGSLYIKACKPAR